MYMSRILSALLIIAVCKQVMSAVTSPHVTVAQGTLRGLQVTSRASGKTYYRFQGIPYAKPPVGSLRFKAPEEPASWSGVRDAINEGGVCPQDGVKSQEDCLFLNVYSPQLPGTRSSSLRPVMVWIHGGGFSKGSGSTRGLGPDYLVDEGVVLVTINYRLGVIGFLSVDGTDVAANAGLKDQVAALHWVKKNIAKFGGDPDNVTIFGESAGGASVSYLVLSPLAKGLFNRAISASGSALNPWAFSPNPSERAFRLGQALGHHGSDAKALVKFLRGLTAEQLIAQQEKALTAEEKKTGRVYAFVGAVEKSVASGDHVFLPDTPYSLLRAGKFNRVPYLTGDCSAEYRESAAALNKSASNWVTMNRDFERFVPYELGLKEGSPKSREVAAAIKKFYFGSKDLSVHTVEQFCNMESDIMFVRGVYKTSMEIIQHSSAPVYNYLFSFDGKLGKSRVHGSTTPIYGPSHGDDLTYLFYYIAVTKPFPANSPEMITLRHIVSIWTNFAKTGNPSAGINVKWPANTAANAHCLNLNATLRIDNGFEKTRMSFWDNIYKLYGKA
ncbi:juvenile hormone esterase [Bacillus rossius redtenbacheri]|uniref:juvenile hormone esterase n=1 Tax=Bacillus rossius redtenbacheri TaxID=93214 RepID=UPI002FDDCB27